MRVFLLAASRCFCAFFRGVGGERRTGLSFRQAPLEDKRLPGRTKSRFPHQLLRGSSLGRAQMQKEGTCASVAESVVRLRLRLRDTEVFPYNLLVLNFVDFSVSNGVTKLKKSGIGYFPGSFS